MWSPDVLRRGKNAFTDYTKGVSGPESRLKTCHAFMPRGHVGIIDKEPLQIKSSGCAGHSRCDLVPDVLSLSVLGRVTKDDETHPFLSPNWQW